MKITLTILAAWLLCTMELRCEIIRLKEDKVHSYALARTGQQFPVATDSLTWIQATSVPGGQSIWFGPRLVLSLDDTNQLPALLLEHRLKYLAPLGPDRFLVLSDSPETAVRTASLLAERPGVSFATPVRRSAIRLHHPISLMPNDPYYPQQTHLDSTLPANTFFAIAPSLYTRNAWSISRGRGVHVAIGDDGVDGLHPDLVGNLAPAHFNFITGTPDGSHTSTSQYHGTAAAGLLAAVQNNGIGVTGVAPEVRLSSWVIFDGSELPAADDQLAAMWMTANNGPDSVMVQSHSWGNADTSFMSVSAVETSAIAMAEQTGRQGLGVVIVRSGGNNRAHDINGNDAVGDANLDQYANDPMQIAVAAVAPSGFACSYSNPGACILLAAPSGDLAEGVVGLTTTDPTGAAGRNSFVDPNNPSSADYLTGSSGFSGTSASAPQIAGLAALSLAVNPRLSVRDVQQMLALSARHPNLNDPELVTNGAGFRVTHSLGFGIPDSGTCLDFARRWSNRPVAVAIVYTNSTSQPIPDDGLRFQLQIPGGLGPLLDVPGSGTLGLQPDSPTEWWPLFDAGTASAALTNSLLGMGALIHREQGVTRFFNSISHVGAAGAPFAVVLNNTGTSERFILRGTDYVPIPAVLVDESDSVQIVAAMSTHASLEGRLILESAQMSWPVKKSLMVEHVQVRILWNHPRASDLRVTLRSPTGTLSILQRPGSSTNAVPSDWTFSSVRHLGESSLGTWSLSITDEAPGMVGSLQSAELRLSGVPITDSDGDGLDDDWERRYFGNLRYGPRDDPDQDGWNNAVEQMLGSDPTVNDRPLRVDLGLQTAKRLRLSWPALETQLYSVEGATQPAGPWFLFKGVPGRYPETGLFFNPSDLPGFFRVRTNP